MVKNILEFGLRFWIVFIVFLTEPAGGPSLKSTTFPTVPALPVRWHMTLLLYDKYGTLVISTGSSGSSSTLQQKVHNSTGNLQ